MSNDKVQSLNEIQSSNDKTNKKPFNV